MKARHARHELGTWEQSVGGKGGGETVEQCAPPGHPHWHCDVQSPPRLEQTAWVVVAEQSHGELGDDME